MNNTQKPFEFSYLESKNSDKIYVEITSGEFSGVVYSMDSISFGEGDDSCTLHYQYDIVKGEVAESKKQKFENSIGDMIVYILEQSIRNGNLKELLSESNAPN
jgi:hypothetical protein